MRTLWITLRTSLALFLICCVVYQLAVTGIAQAFMSKQANGSLVYDNNHQVVGSELIGQSFTEPQYFQGRVSSIEYNGNGSGSPNFAPSNPDLMKRLQSSVSAWQQQNPDVPVSTLPVDLVTNSGSGLDPDISPEAARAQIPRISQLTGVTTDQLQSLVQQQTKSRPLGIFGEPTVNVLQLNLTLQKELNPS